jgi:hypothetical protein
MKAYENCDDCRERAVGDRGRLWRRDLHVEPVHLPHGRTMFLFDGIK